MSSKHFFGALIIVSTIIVAPLFARASDLSYGYIQSARAGTEVHINYRGPDGARDVICNVTTFACRAFDPKTDPFRLTDAIDLPWTPSPDAASAVLKISTNSGTVYALANLSGSLTLSLIPITDGSSVSRAIYSRDSKTIVFVGKKVLQVYKPATGKVASFDVAAPLSMTLVSPSGDYLSWYSYTAQEHEIVSLATGAKTAIRSKTPGYFEVAENGKWGIFKEASGDKQTLKMATLPDGHVTDVGAGPLIDDYIVHKNVAYYTTNTRSPLSWSLLAYDPNTGKTTEVDRNIAYTDYMKSVDGALLYYKVSGNHGDVYAYRPDTGTTNKLAGQNASSYTPVAVRKEMDIGDVHGALLDSDTNTNTKKPLIIWLHGGPERQTSAGFHPYLSYGVYDEMLERFVQAGARVAKIDYTGSVGYGQKFDAALKKKIGVTDVDDVVSAIDDLTDTYATSDVYLIGNSYGGYLALKALVDEPKLIDGAASINGVTDWQTLIGSNTSSIFAPYFGGIYGSRTKKYYRAAEILDNVDRIPDSTPIVIAYGSQDATVPPAQSKDFIATAEEEDKNVTTLVFDSEEHILRERATLNKLCSTVAKAFDLSTNVCSQ